ncbi:unnamed protein product [Rotaria sp. Silwood2]|nr:unnamed protein product [Rotaria sp. Silwood2]
MFGSLGQGLRETAIALIGAFQKMGIENYGVITFGRTVRLVKTSEQAWDTAVVATLFQQIRFDQDDESKDAHALEAAIDLLINSTSRGEKKIFLITDGYGNGGELLPLVQQRAENGNIDLIAMAIGNDRVNLRASYQRYVCCQTPYGLPKALRELFENASSSKAIDWPPQSKQRSGSMSNSDSTTTTDPNTLFTNLAENKKFAKIIDKMAGQRDIQLIHSGSPPSNVIVNICFCLDCTGSMSRWLSETKVQMKVIIQGINAQIKQEYPDLNLELRFAIVGFRDVNDANRFQVRQFDSNVNNVLASLNELTATGGGDIPEDVMGALDQCLTLQKWNESNARFIVLITDAPGHGKELNDDPSDQYPNGTGHTLNSICDRLLKKEEEIELMFCCVKPAATLKMQKAFEAKYTAKKEETGKAFTTIKLFDDEKAVAQSFHFVFVLDESISMSGQPWNDMIKAYQGFLDRRTNDQGGDDLFSVIQFGSTGRITCERQSLFNTPRNLNPVWSGTAYITGLQSADAAISRDNSKSSVVLIFMSDGGDGGAPPLPTIDSLVQKYRSNHNFICHTVGFGNDVKPGTTPAKLLSDMATHGRGNMYPALDGLQLAEAFGKIAADCTVSGTLVNRFAEILSREISVKIAVDYL